MGCGHCRDNDWKYQREPLTNMMSEGYDIIHTISMDDRYEMQKNESPKPGSNK